jgi:hypothetical protein
MAVDRVARQYLDLEEARRELKEALSVVVEFAQRDPIESALNQVRSASEEAYFYAGLAFGVTFAEFQSPQRTWEAPRGRRGVRCYSPSQ